MGAALHSGTTSCEIFALWSSESGCYTSVLLQEIEDMLQAAAHDPDVGPPSGFSSPSSLDNPAAPSGYSSDEEAGRGLADDLSDSDSEYSEQRGEEDDSYSD